MVVLEESIEVANVLVKLRSSEKGIIELKKRIGRDKGPIEGDGVKLETTKAEIVRHISPIERDEEDHETSTQDRIKEEEEDSLDASVDGQNHSDDEKEKQDF